MQGEAVSTAESSASLLASISAAVDALFSALWALLHPILTTVDPLCGPVGVFNIFLSKSLLACGAAGWGDEIAFGFYVTASLSLCTLPFGLLLGFFLALAKQSQEPYLRRAADIYITLFRGLPELLTLFIIYYGMQQALQSALAGMGYDGPVEINAFAAGMIALSVVFSSYCAEVLQSAFKAIPRGQYEGGYAVGLSRGKTMRLVVLPQLIRIALPGLGNLWMTLLKDTALVSIVGLSDIMRQTQIAARVSKQAFFFYGNACLLYLVLAILSSFVFSWIERRAKQAEVRA
ncbi:ABC transporter permease [Rhizobium sp. TRM95796]|uniref:ABC transporter permease n=1 Tax=Rhizobium sp. TRM95796 TaxID=2979862 RepID=UPI0021E8404C|nr:ABC transporter permease [Rhizobium sp. TRM95796]MCV3765220.1 ABC transporter permease [Rhizobium sp. TRM95796]